MDEGSTAQTLLQAFMRFKRMEWHQRNVLGYKPSEIKLLFCIHKGRRADSPGMKLSEISQTLRVTPPTVTQLIKDLESNGLVERAFDPTDRRAVLVRLTPKGDALTAAASEAFVRAFEALVAHLGEDKSRQLALLLNEVFQYYTTKEPPAPQPPVKKEDGLC
ncbi:MarR family transcriptional regulator [Heliobacterium gestii]|uniref:MarR family transcriptional regulator n=1 Tax=Heliomicrobium gestii TaxID=2699 RepID=A0A845LBL8_HELGE|nr:MarR family winged helix-turn-helix transcriptional regulator [Heliomicrobium gestii]MBM7866892.1 DNA-binding MarR family transcriptional regulator [Heliomicrobium gestii]MZP42320.1 MarR family transcriptional regulator [Heliomicrobium gestii]